MKQFNIFTWLLAGLVLSMPLSTAAAELQTGERVNISPETQLADDVYLGAGMVNTAGSILGDLLAGGGTLTIDGSVSEDVTAAGGNVTILGDVADDVRVAGGSVVIAGTVGDEVAIAAGQTQLSGDGIGGDLLWVGGTLTVNSPIDGSLKLTGGEVYLNAPVAGNVEFSGDKLVLGSGAAISGDLSYQSPNEAEMQSGATVNGETIYTELARDSRSDEAREGVLAAILTVISIGTLIWLLTRLVSAWVLGLGLRGYTQDLVTTAFARPWAELGRGFVVLVVMPAAAVVLAVTVVGLPLAVMTVLVYVVTLIFASLMAPILLGSLVYKWLSKSREYRVTWSVILLGVVLFMVLNFIPVLGWIAQLVLILFTLGAATRIKWRVLKEYFKR